MTTTDTNFTESAFWGASSLESTVRDPALEWAVGLDDNVGVSTTSSTWSPADNPYAIAVSEAQWWLRCAVLTGHRIHDGDDPRSGFSSRQIDARQLVVALWQLRMAEKLQQASLRALGMEQAVLADLSRGRVQFEKAVPGIQQMRNALLHFDEWAQGTGDGPQKKDAAAGMALRDVASKYWHFDYDPATEQITLGPYIIHVDTALAAAKALADAIYRAARAVDLRTAAELRARTVEALTATRLLDGAAGDALRVSPGGDTRVWVSLNTTPGLDHLTLSEQVIGALADADLQLLSSIEPQSSNPAERLGSGEALYVAPIDTMP